MHVRNYALNFCIENSMTFIIFVLPSEEDDAQAIKASKR